MNDEKTERDIQERTLGLRTAGEDQNSVESSIPLETASRSKIRQLRKEWGGEAYRKIGTSSRTPIFDSMNVNKDSFEKGREVG